MNAVYPFLVKFRNRDFWIATAPGKLAKATPEEVAKVYALVRQEKDSGHSFWSRVY
jgi:hypothetical protein